MNGLANRGFNCLRRLRGARVNLDSAGMLSLQIGPVDRGANLGAQIVMLDVADDTDNGRIEFNVVAATLDDGAAQRILRRAEESLGEGQIDDGDTGLTLAHLQR